jgi:hypothetical protein
MYENSDSNVLVMQSTEQRMRHDVSDPLNRTRSSSSVGHSSGQRSCWCSCPSSIRSWPHDMVWFGALVVVTLQTAFLSPPGGDRPR